jgi:methionine-rich copper-binding protein CopC
MDAITINPVAPGTTTFSLWNSTTTPGTIDSGDGQSVELGVKFTSDINGFITGLKFYKSAANTGTHIGSLWTSSGQLLASATFTNETASGWQQVNFATPVAVTAGALYVASYYAPNGHYSINSTYFATSSASDGPLHELSSGSVNGYNGVYSYGATGFPSISSPTSNYWIDVVLSTTTNTAPPAVTAITPVNNAGNVAINTTVTITFSEAMNSTTVNSISVSLRDGQNQIVPATVTYNVTNNTATLTPTTALANSSSYNVLVGGGSSGVTSSAGTPLPANVTSTFVTTASQQGGGGSQQSSSSLFGASITPTIVDSGDAEAVELGVNFTASTNGFITGIRFYKSAANTVTHTGSLWSASGQLLATATFTSETASGWQQVSFSTPVAVTAGTTYVASYHTTIGHYSMTQSYFTSAYTSGPLTVPANGGVYLYGAGGFPTGTFKSSNYFVDFVFSSTPPANTTPPTVTAFSPANGSTNVATSSPITVTFSEAMNAATVNSSTVQLMNGNAAVTASVTYNSANNTATLTPTAALANSTYTIVVKGGTAGVADSSGNLLAANATSSFTTASPINTTPPTVTAFSPANGSTNVATSTVVTISFSEALNTAAVNTGTIFLRDASNVVVTATIAYNVATNTVTVTPTSALANSATYTIVVKSGSAGVKDVAGNALVADATSSFTTTAPAPVPAPAPALAPAATSSLWAASATPSIVDSLDTQAVELGTKFTSDTNGFITGLRFYKSAANTGTHTASLWTASGQRLATATFTGETGSGWQQVNFATPVAITAGTTYVASYHTTSGHYSVSRPYFASPFNNGLLHAPANAGVYLYGTGGFPTATYQGSNYWVDVVLSTTAPVDTTPPTVTVFSPTSGATNVATSSAATVTFSEALNAATVTSNTIFLRNASNVVVAANVAYNAATNTATVTPTSALANSTTYTIVVKSGSAGVTDVAGNALAVDATSSFTTAAAPVTPPVTPPSSLWTAAAIPNIVDSGDSQAVVLGTQFTADVNGVITGLKFYKSAANTGTHTASLWTAAGQLLATATFMNETASGWQQVIFSSPVAIAAGTTYVASYTTTSGHYSVSRSYFTSPFTSGLLHVPANGGVYIYGASGFPTSSYQSSNYWIDLLFTPSGT